MFPPTPSPCARMLLVAAILVACGALLGHVRGQAIAFRTDTQADGLPSARTFGLAQDRGGVLWASTQAGLARNDGRGWSRAPGLTRSRTGRIVADPRVGIWILGLSPRDSGLRFGRSGRTVIPPCPATGPYTAAIARVMDGRDALFAATTGGGVQVLQDGRWSPHPELTVEAVGQVLTMLSDEDGLLLGTDRGLVRQDADGSMRRLSDRFTDVAVHGLALEHSRRTGRVVWILTEAGLFRRDVEGTEAVARFEPPLAMSVEEGEPTLIPDGFGGVILGTPHEARRYDAVSGRISPMTTKEGLPGSGVFTGFRDREGGIWLGGLRGISHAPALTFLHYGAAQGLPVDEVSALLELPSGALAVGQPGFVAVLDGDIRRKRAFPRGENPEAERAIELCPDGAGGFWVAANAVGVGHHAVGQEPTWYDLGERSALSVHRTADGSVWLGTSRGLSLFDRTAFRDVPLHQGRSVFVRRVHAHGDALFLGTRSGLLRRDENGRCVELPGSEGLSVYAILTSKTGDVLVASDRGLGRIEGDRLRPVATPPFLIPPAYSLCEDRDGALWVGTGNGFFRRSGEHWRRFGEEDGLLGLEANRGAALVDSRARLWLGTDRGLALYRPEYDRGSAPPPPPPFVRVMIPVSGSSEMSGEHQVSLDAGVDDILIRFGAPTFVTRELEFAYRLEGADDDAWRIRRAPLVTEVAYANLSPGLHRFGVKVRREGGAFGPVVRSAPIRIVARKSASTVWLWGLGVLLSGACAAYLHLRWRGRVRLQESERRYRELFENNRSAQLLIDATTGRVLDANPAALKFYGLSVEDLRENTLGRFEPDDEHDIEECLLGVLERGSGQFVASQRDARGRWRNMEFRASVYREDRGLIQATAHDITHRRELERVIATTSKLEAVGRLAGGVAHDFNNLLAVIIGCSENALRMTDPHDPRGDDLQEIIRTSESGAALVKKLLVLGRRNVSTPAPLGVNRVLQGTRHLLVRSLGEDIEIQLDLMAGEGTVRADQTELEQALVNIVINARDAMPCGGTLRIETSEVEMLEEDSAVSVRALEPGRYVSIKVEDTGCGMPPKVLARVFEPFFTTKGEERGSGLGLAAVYGFATAAGGTARIESREGVGTTCQLLLPLLDRTSDARRRPVRKPRAPVRAATILLVEDDEGVRRLTARMLERGGHTVFAGEDADELLERVAREGHDPDLLLTDVVMPRRGGAAVARLVRRQYPEIRVLYMSGYPGNELPRRGIDQDRLIEKPFDSRRLLARVADALNEGLEGMATEAF